LLRRTAKRWWRFRLAYSTTSPFDGTGNALSSQNDSNGFGLFAEVYDNFTLAGKQQHQRSPLDGRVLLSGDPRANHRPGTSCSIPTNAGQPDSLLYSFNINTTGGEAFLGNYSGFPAYTYDVSLTTPFRRLPGRPTGCLSCRPRIPASVGLVYGTGGDGISYQDFLGTRSELLYDMAFTLEGSGSSFLSRQHDASWRRADSAGVRGASPASLVRSVQYSRNPRPRG